MQLQIVMEKAVKKWQPILEHVGIKDSEKIEWVSEMAEYHNLYNLQHGITRVNENAYTNASNVAGLGTITSPQPSLLPGTTIGSNWSGNGGTNGSGDLGQNLLPVSMKIAAQTIGLDLITVKPSPGSKIDLVYVDFQYDDNNLGATDERPIMFKLDFSNFSAATYSVFTNMINAVLATYSIIQTSGGLTTTTGANVRVFTTINGTASNGSTGIVPSTLASYVHVNATGSVGAGNTIATTTDPNIAGANLNNVVEFLGYSRIDGYPMFRSFKQANTAQTNSYPYINNATTGANATWMFDNNRNTFTPNVSMLSQIIQVFGVNLNGQFQIDLISALEDQIPGYVGNFNQGGRYPMDRAQEENVYAGQIGPKISSKSIAIGTSMIKSVLRRTDIEDIKSNTGIDIVQKMESILVNELSQTMSKQIVWKIQELGGLNRLSAPLYKGTLSTIPGQTMFDLDTAYVASGPGGETTHAVQRKLVTKMTNASHYILTEGRIGTAQFAVTNGSLAAAMVDNVGYTINPTKSKLNSQGQLYPVGEIGGIQIYVDPYQKFDDNRITIGRKNNAEQPGLLFIPYLMAQSVTITSEATMAPVMQIRSRYAIAEVGFFPFKQYMTIIVNDNGGYLN